MLNTFFIYLNKVSSTIQYAKNYINNSPKLDNNIIIIANTQTNGVGKLNRIWESPRGNLYLTAIFKPFPLYDWKNLKDINIFNLLISLSVLDWVKGILGKNVYSIFCKWPNDILLNEGKIGGILLENVSISGLDILLVSMGINIKHAPVVKNYKTSCLAQIKNINLSLSEIAYSIIKKIYHNIYYLNKEEVINHWLKHAYKLGDNIDIIIGNNHKKGIFKGINNNGLLLLEVSPNNIEVISAGEIY